jgi:molybdopterin converting factor small subunit
MPSWEIKLFAYLRERHGPTARVEASSTAGAVLDALAAKGIGGDYCRLAVNRAFASRDLVLNPGDELALIPPVSGG